MTTRCGQRTPYTTTLPATREARSRVLLALRRSVLPIRSTPRRIASRPGMWAGRSGPVPTCVEALARGLDSWPASTPGGRRPPTRSPWPATSPTDRAAAADPAEPATCGPRTAVRSHPQVLESHIAHRLPRLWELPRPHLRPRGRTGESSSMAQRTADIVYVARVSVPRQPLRVASHPLPPRSGPRRARCCWARSPRKRSTRPHPANRSKAAALPCRPAVSSTQLIRVRPQAGSWPDEAGRRRTLDRRPVRDARARSFRHERYVHAGAIPSTAHLLRLLPLSAETAGRISGDFALWPSRPPRSGPRALFDTTTHPCSCRAAPFIQARPRPAAASTLAACSASIGGRRRADRTAAAPSSHPRHGIDHRATIRTP